MTKRLRKLPPSKLDIHGSSQPDKKATKIWSIMRPAEFDDHYPDPDEFQLHILKDRHYPHKENFFISMYKREGGGYIVNPPKIKFNLNEPF